MDPKEKLEEMALARLDSPEPSNRDLADAQVAKVLAQAEVR